MFSLLICFIAGIGAGLGMVFVQVSAVDVISMTLIIFLRMPICFVRRK